MIPVVDQDKCIGCGLCATIYPEAFQMGPDHKSEVQELPEYDEVLAQKAMDECPVQAISIDFEEEEGSEDGMSDDIMQPHGFSPDNPPEHFDPSVDVGGL